MFNLKYNFIVFIQIILELINAILIIKIFGVSVQSDAYLLGLSSIAVLLVIATFPSGLFIPYYNDLKVKSVDDSHKFYNSSIFVSFIFGILCFIVTNFFISLIAKLFVFNIDIERFNLFKQILQILSFQLIFYPVNQINEQLFNAEMKFSLPYILSVTPIFFVIIAQFITIYFNSTDIVYLAVAQSLGYICIALFGTIYISKNLIKFKFEKWHYIQKEQIRKSIILKFGDFGWGIALPILFNNFLALFPKGYVSYFYYAKKIIDTINNFTTGPSIRILQSKISKLIALKDKMSIEKLYKPFMKYGILILIFMLTITYFIQTPILKFISNNLTNNDLKMISVLFLILCPWYIIIFLEKAYLEIVHMSKKAIEIFFINMIFILIFAPLLFIIKPILEIYSIGFALMCAQLSNFISYRIIAKRILVNIRKE